VISLGTVAKEAFGPSRRADRDHGHDDSRLRPGAGIVKLDDAGLFLSRHEGESGLVRAKRALGRGILRAALLLMNLPHTEATAWHPDCLRAH
jgi:hypothetical protein